MGKTSITVTTTKIFQILHPLDSLERKRVLSAALTFLGEESLDQSNLDLKINKDGAASKNQKDYFNDKDPQTKVEEFAVAARFREINENAETNTKEDFVETFGKARRNFDLKNFSRDLDNAKRCGYFTKSDNITLAHYGQKYVDTLPDRESAKLIKKPKLSNKRGAVKLRKGSTKTKK